MPEHADGGGAGSVEGAQCAARGEDLERSRMLGKSPPADVDTQFDGMSLDQLREFITENTGHKPLGSLNRKSLVRMATAAQQKAYDRCRC